ncbi:MAG: nuclear transport factor 2 family protein [Acidimicrobiia bacterium]|nr:nuclear transport factor 2 family protein [Acidimicrobiia bacterium]MBT8215424.1 nuclear transport factor 2 family protein [Acidimicrobiia bacterium]NNF08978.1 nuclear transport factor 2 family protein [Acidimicrobiia bacterium]NNL71568.1 nuclear transport factor 2 family protein [Acidimicrobiia bacterium]
MTTAERPITESRIREFFDACNAGDVDAIASFFTHDAVYYGSLGPDDDGTAYRGVDEVRAGMAAFLGNYRDAHYSDVSVHVLGDRGFATWTFSGVPPSGEPFRYRGVDILEFAGNLIKKKDAFRKERTEPTGR